MNIAIVVSFNLILHFYSLRLVLLLKLWLTTVQITNSAGAKRISKGLLDTGVSVTAYICRQSPDDHDYLS